MPLVHRYVDLLATDGVVRGLIGPREAPRLWDRHIMNCAVLGELVPSDCDVLDVGSGAGLPGLVLALARPDLRTVLIEPMARRVAFLDEAVAALDLTARVQVWHGRAEDYDGPRADVVTARAVAPLDRLATFCLPLARLGGRLLAIKGSSAVGEVAEHAPVVRELGGGTPEVRQCGVGLADPPTTVIEVVRTGTPAIGGQPAQRRGGQVGRGRRQPERPRRSAR